MTLQSQHNAPASETRNPYSCLGRGWLRVVLLGATAIGVAAYALPTKVTIESCRSPVATLKPKGLLVTCLCFDPSGRYLIVGSRSMTSTYGPAFYLGELSVWDVVDKVKLCSIATPHWVSALSVSNKNALVAVAIGGPKEDVGWKNDGTPREIRVYSFPKMKQLSKVEIQYMATSLVMPADGKVLAAAHRLDGNGESAQVSLWDIPSLKAKYWIKGLSRTQTYVQFTHDAKTLALIDYGRAPNKAELTRFRRYDASTGKPENETSLPGYMRDTSFLLLADGKTVIIDWRKLSSLDMGTGKAVDIVEKAPKGFRNRYLAISADGQWLLTANNLDNSSIKLAPRVIIWDLVAKKTVDDWEPKGLHRVGPIAISPDKKTLAIAAEQVYLFDLSDKSR